MFNNLMLFVATGLETTKTTVIDNYINPIFFIAVAVIAIYFLKDRRFRELAAFVGIAIIIGLLINFGPELFGKSGQLTTKAKDIAGVNAKIVNPGEILGSFRSLF